MNTDLPPSEMPAPIWPPPPRLRPPKVAPAAPHTLTPLAWMDAVIGLPGGIVLAYLAVTAAFGVTSLFFPPLRLSLGWMAARPCLALAGAALLCAAACRVVGRRFPVFAVAAAAGALPVISLFVWMYWPRSR